eukprot:TRINITY_DN3496_c2_g2_i1.p1 TRINITY_DN3496_c2_g2~~TRINITY_DN3496_c2_g2_i1.p1  ORF type:complete len:195 (-),score=35.74 TRINITY_DN3496_c2_g2_i1:195-779(-)
MKKTEELLSQDKDCLWTPSDIMNTNQNIPPTRATRMRNLTGVIQEIWNQQTLLKNLNQKIELKKLKSDLLIFSNILTQDDKIELGLQSVDIELNPYLTGTWKCLNNISQDATNTDIVENSGDLHVTDIRCFNMKIITQDSFEFYTRRRGRVNRTLIKYEENIYKISMSIPLEGIDCENESIDAMVLVNLIWELL